MKVVVDPSVLGGIVATVGDTVIDGTVRTRTRPDSKSLSVGRTTTHGRAHLISTADIAAALKKNLEGFEPSLEARTVGRVTEVGDGIARVSAGCPTAASTSCSSSRTAPSAWP